MSSDGDDADLGLSDDAGFGVAEYLEPASSS
jgi:hypothetical protein